MEIDRRQSVYVGLTRAEVSALDDLRRATGARDRAAVIRRLVLEGLAKAKDGV